MQFFLRRSTCLDGALRLPCEHRWRFSVHDAHAGMEPRGCVERLLGIAKELAPNTEELTWCVCGAISQCSISPGAARNMEEQSHLLVVMVNAIMADLYQRFSFAVFFGTGIYC